MPKARNDHTNPPISGLDRPLWVLRMNWWHFSDANRLKWLRVLQSELKATLNKVSQEIIRLETARSRFPGEAKRPGHRVGMP